MSKPLNFWNKVKFFSLYLKHHEHGVFVNCAYCGSVNITFNNQQQYEVFTPGIGTEKNRITRVYSGEYTCMDCGARCSNRQEWFHPEPEEKMFPKFPINLKTNHKTAVFGS